MHEFLEGVVEAIHTDEEDNNLMNTLRPILDSVKQSLQKNISLGAQDLFTYVDLVLFFSRTPCLGEVGLLIINTNKPGFIYFYKHHENMPKLPYR